MREGCGGWQTFRLTFRLTLVGRHNALAPFCCSTTISLEVTPSGHQGTYPHTDRLVQGFRKKDFTRPT